MSKFGIHNTKATNHKSQKLKVDHMKFQLLIQKYKNWKLNFETGKLKPIIENLKSCNRKYKT